MLDWALEQARLAGFSSVTVACEATGHRWRVVEKLTAERGLALVCVQSVLVWRAREREDRKAVGGDLSPVRRMGPDRFLAAVRRELVSWGGQRNCLRIVRALFAALDDVVGLVRHRYGAFERAGFVADDWRATRAGLAEVEARMVGVLDELELTALVTSIPSLSAVGPAAVLAESGDPARFTSTRALVKHAGLCPRDNSGGSHRGRGRLSGRGRPGLRVAAWRAGWGAQHANPVLAARYAHLTRREHNRLNRGQARAACAATLLRWIHGVAVRRVPWDADIAAGTRSAAGGGGIAAAA